MKIIFLGANHEVTGSRTLLEAGGKYALVDCGMEQGRDLYENAPMPVAAGELSCVFLTHAHIDHSGLLPLLYKRGFRGAVYATRETCSLCEIMLRDSAHIQESEAEYKNRKGKRAGKAAVEPLYTLEDAEGVLSLFRPMDYGREARVEEGFAVCFHDVGHLLGSAAVEIWLSEGATTRHILFSGDVGNTNQPIIRDPQPVSGAPYLVLEATYGDRLHERSDADTVLALASLLQKTLDRGGNVIIPSFAVGRTQEILYFIREIKERGLVVGHDGFPVYLDSPLANEATAVFLQCDPACLDEDARAVMARGENPLVFPGLHTFVTTEESKLLNTDPTPKVIISAGGMCDAGRVRHHLKYNLWRPESLVLFVGYQAVGTLGRDLYEGAKKVRLFGEEIAVRAEMALLPGVSGHADQAGLLAWVDAMAEKPATVFVNHSEDGPAAALAGKLRERGCAAEIPFSGAVYDLAAEKWDYQAPARRLSEAADRREAPREKALRRLNAVAEALAALVTEARDAGNRQIEALADALEELARRWKKKIGGN